MKRSLIANFGAKLIKIQPLLVAPRHCRGRDPTLSERSVTAKTRLR